MQADSAAKSISQDFAQAIDELRAQHIKTAADAEHFGVPLPKAEKAAAVEGAEAEATEPDAFDGVEGLAEETKAALRQPQVREYLEATEREHSEVRQAYTAARSVPPVQRPGTARSAREASYDDVSALDARLSKTGSLKDAEKLLFAKLGRR
jgi:hypothetical protein